MNDKEKTGEYASLKPRVDTRGCLSWKQTDGLESLLDYWVDCRGWRWRRQRQKDP